MKHEFRSIVTVTLNPTIDRIIEVPGFEVGGHQQGKLRVRKPAGKAINVSLALAELGVRCTAVGWVGMNAFDLFHETMQSAKVKACFLPITGLTRENITIIDPTRHSETHIRDAGPRVEAADVRRLVDLLQTVVAEDTLVIFNGSLPPGLTLESWNELIGTCLTRGAEVAIDISGEPLRMAVERSIWMVKPNELELAELTGSRKSDEASIIQTARRLAERIPIVLITVGRRGAYCLAEGAVWHAQAVVPQEAVQSTVGCGDAMLAGFLAGLVSGQGNIEAALREGVAISAAAALTEEPGRFDRSTVNQLRRTIQSRSIA